MVIQCVSENYATVWNSHIHAFQVVLEIKMILCSSKNTRNVSYEGAKGDNMLVIRDTDVPVITLRFYYVCVLWEYNCMRTYYRAPASEQIACSYKA